MPDARKAASTSTHELRADAGASSISSDVEIRQRPETWRAPACKREPDRNAVVVLGDERDLGRDDLAHLRELLLLVGRAFVGRWRDLVVELTPEIRDRARDRRLLHAGRSRRYPAILAPASRNWAERFSNGANRSLMRRTSSIERERPAA